MFFNRIEPPASLKHIIECYWVMEDQDPTPVKQKIIPDGFTEIIFHFKDPYRIRMGNTWELQPPHLIAGQIRKYFFLENTGASKIVGVKLKPAALTHLYSLDMHLLTDRTVGIPGMIEIPSYLLDKVYADADTDEFIDSLNIYFSSLPATGVRLSPADIAIEMIFNKNGLVSMAELCDEAGIGERQLENIFKKWIGLSPKFFSRIIRFNYIFELVKNTKNWTDLTYEAAYYDQSHFIRNFRAFTGESPSAYAFDEKNMANFFLKKKSA